MINTIVLDIGGVLAHFGWKEYLRGCGYGEETFQRVANATVRNKLWSEWDRGRLKEAELIELHCKQDPGVEKEIRDFFEHIFIMVREYDYTHDFVRRLKENGYRIYLLSNYGRQHFEKCRAQDFSFLPYIDGKIISYSVNYIKPEPEIYEALIKKYGINPSEAVFLDDVQANLEGAEHFGFHTVLFGDYNQALEALKSLGVRI
jgi:putative hydrolase of the HAD superfamily